MFSLFTIGDRSSDRQALVDWLGRNTAERLVRATCCRPTCRLGHSHVPYLVLLVPHSAARRPAAWRSPVHGK
jgi:hypothetical protein